MSSESADGVDVGSGVGEGGLSWFGGSRGGDGIEGDSWGDDGDAGGSNWAGDD